MSAPEEPPLEPAESPAMVLLRLRTRELNEARRRDRRAQSGYFDAHPPREDYLDGEAGADED